jgi:general stress protein YciG
MILCESEPTYGTERRNPLAYRSFSQHPEATMEERMPTKKNGSSKRGFASMDDDAQREIAAKGGSRSGGNFAKDRDRAAEAGRKGGEARSSQSK